MKALNRKTSCSSEKVVGDGSKPRIWGQLYYKKTKFSMLAYGSILLGLHGPHSTPALPLLMTFLTPTLHSVLCLVLFPSPRLPIVLA